LGDDGAAEAGVQRVRDLRGRTVAITANTTNLEQLRAADAQQGLQLKLLVVKDTGEGFQRFAAGEADAFVADDVLLAALVAASLDPKTFVISSARFSGLEPYAIMLRKDDAVFKALVDRATSTLLRSNEGTAIYAKWFEQQLPGRTLTLALPMAPELRKAFASPTNSADSAAYAR